MAQRQQDRNTTQEARSVLRRYLGRDLQLVHGGMVFVSFLLSGLGLTLLGVHKLTTWVVAALVIAFVLAVSSAFASHRGFHLLRDSGPYMAADPDAWGEGSPPVGGVDVMQALLFAQGLLFSDALTSRIKERVVPATRSLQFDTSYTLRLPDYSGGDWAFVPLIVARKATLFDNLHITASGGDEIPTLSFQDYIQLVKTMLQQLIRLKGEDVFESYTGTVEEDLLRAIAGPAPQVGDGGATEEVIGRLESIVGPQRDSGTLAVNLANQLIYQYAIVIALAPDDRLNSKDRENGTRWEIVNTSQRVLLPREAPAFVWRWPIPFVIDRCRRVFGVQPSSFRVPIEKAHLASSYHLEFVGPVDTYLARQRLSWKGNDRAAYGRLRLRLGQRYAHLYIRGLSEVREDISLKLSFFERPPGSLGAATVAALSVFALTVIGGRLAGMDPSPTNGDLVAVLLAFPGVAAAWVGLERPGGVFGGTLAARLSSAATLMMVLVGTALYLGAVRGPDSLVCGFSMLGVHGAWLVLAILSALNFSWILFAWARRAILYMAVQTRQDPNGATEN